MTQESNGSGRTYIVLAVLVLMVVAAWAFWQRQRAKEVASIPQTDMNNLRKEAETAESVAQLAPPEAGEKTGDGSGATKTKVQGDENSSVADPGTSSGSFIPQEGYASIPDDRFYTTTGMTGLVPNAPATQFEAGDAVYIYAGINAPKGERIQIRWFDPQGNHILPSVYKNILKNTGSVGYRIYTYRIFRAPGRYLVKLYNSAGTVIGETGFVVAG